eukprot:468830-Amorphochlora_amoeboformis.AAC.3
MTCAWELRGSYVFVLGFKSAGVWMGCYRAALLVDVRNFGAACAESCLELGDSTQLYTFWLVRQT